MKKTNNYNQFLLRKYLKEYIWISICTHRIKCYSICCAYHLYKVTINDKKDLCLDEISNRHGAHLNSNCTHPLTNKKTHKQESKQKVSISSHFGFPEI